MMFGLSRLVKSSSLSATFVACANFLRRARRGRRCGRCGRVPTIDGNLAGDDEGALVVAVLDDFKEIAGLIGCQAFRSPIVAVAAALKQFYRAVLPCDVLSFPSLWPSHEISDRPEVRCC